MKRINEIPLWENFFTFLNVPHMDNKERLLASMLLFKHGERILYEPSLNFLESDLESFAVMIKENFSDKWEKDFNALNLEYDILYSNRVIYDEDISEETTSTGKQVSVNQGKENQNSRAKDDNAKNAFDDVSSNSPVFSSSGENKRETETRMNEETQDDMTGNSTIKKGYVKKYSNGSNGATAIENDIASRKTRYIELVLKDIVNYIALSVY